MKAKKCECCMMPLSHDPKDSGSDLYCSYCYVDGKLLAEGMTRKEFQDKTCRAMIAHGMNKYVARLFSHLIRFAPYWKNK